MPWVRLPAICNHVHIVFGAWYVCVVAAGAAPPVRDGSPAGVVETGHACSVCAAVWPNTPHIFHCQAAAHLPLCMCMGMQTRAGQLRLQVSSSDHAWSRRRLCALCISARPANRQYPNRHVYLRRTTAGPLIVAGELDARQPN